MALTPFGACVMQLYLYVCILFLLLSVAFVSEKMEKNVCKLWRFCVCGRYWIWSRILTAFVAVAVVVGSPSNWQMCIYTQMQKPIERMCRQLSIQLQMVFFWSFKSIYEIPLAIRIALQCIAIQWDRTIRTMFMAVSRRPNISNFIIVKRWHEYSCKTPPRLSLLQNRKTFNAHRNWWMHANQPQYINWNGKIEFYSSNTMCNWRTATTTATKKKQNTCNRRYTEEKKQRKKNGIELNICHLYWFATYTRANNIVVNIDRWGNYFRLWWFFFRFVSRFMAFFLCTFFQLLYSLFSATLFLTVILKVI